MICRSLVLTNQTPSLSRVYPRQSVTSSHRLSLTATMGQLTPHATSVFGFPRHLVIPFLTCLPLQDYMRSPQVLSITICHHSDHNHTNDSLAFMPCLNTSAIYQALNFPGLWAGRQSSCHLWFTFVPD